MPLFGVYVAGCLLLTAAGAAKVLRPESSARAIAAVVGTSTAGITRLLRPAAAAEAAMGAWALLSPRPLPAALVSASYAGFGTFVLLVRRWGGSLATCGCFGTPDTPATRLHAAVNLALSVAAAAVAIADGPRTVTAVLAGQPLHGVPLVLAGGACAWLALHVMSTLARLGAARKGSAGGSIPGRGPLEDAR